MCFALRCLMKTISLIVGKDQGGNANIQVKTNDEKAEVCNCVKD